MKPSSARAPTLAVALAVAVGLTGCGESISDPWTSGQGDEQLEHDRTRTYEQQQELRGRLDAYAEPYE